MERKTKLLISISIVLYYLVGLVYGLPDTNPLKVDSSVLDELKDKDEVFVFVRLTDNPYTSSKYDNLGDRRMYEQMRDNYLKIEKQYERTLNRSEFRVTNYGKLDNGLFGYITKAGVQRLSHDNNVVRIFGDRYSSALLTESVPMIGANTVWALNYTGKGHTICIVDTGVNYSHPDLGGCTWSLLGGYNCTWKRIGGYDYFDGDSNIMDMSGHGTHVAGIAVANGSVKGVAPDADLLMYRVCGSDTNCSELAEKQAIDDCVDNAVSYNISVISISLGRKDEKYNSTSCPSPENDSLIYAINRARDTNMFVAVASGNEHYTDGIGYPACAAGAFSVGAVYDANVGIKILSSCTDFTTYQDAIVCLTNRNTDLDILAPGCEIYSTTWDGGHSIKCGTSMATPHIAGVVTLLKQINGNLTPDDIEFALKNTSKVISDNCLMGCSGLNYSRVDAYNASLMVLRSVLLTVSNDGTANLSISTINTSASWVSSIYPTSFVLLPSNATKNWSKSIMVTVDLQDTMPVGSYSTDLLVYSNDPDEPVKHVPLVYQRVHAGCTGVCPPASGDWNVTSYTALWTNNTAVNGKVNILNSSTLFLGELEANATTDLQFTDGELRLDGAALRFN